MDTTLTLLDRLRQERRTIGFSSEKHIRISKGAYKTLLDISIRQLESEIDKIKD